MPKQLTAIDLFAGAGGFSLAAHQQDFDILAAVELDDRAAETYCFNLKGELGATTEVFNQDINKVDVQALMKFQGIKQGKLDLLLGGPPCQGFSSHRIKNSGENDPRNQLLIRYFDFVAALMPRAFLVENVPGLLWKRHEEYLHSFIELAHSHNYKIISGHPMIINARDYGVPQGRKRAFILAVREDVCCDKLIWPPEPTHVKANEEKPSWNTASTVFEKPPQNILDELISEYTKSHNFTFKESKVFVESLQWGDAIPEGDKCNIRMQHTKTITDVFASTKLNGSRGDSNRTLPCHSNGYKGHKDVYGRIFFHTPSNTITTGCNNPSKGRFVHPWLHHGITLRHAARLQTFPDTFQFIGNTSQQGNQIGNAVPFNLGFALIKTIKEQILSNQ
jgi:DNA (cytosine-5)-methyltransferase 1